MVVGAVFAVGQAGWRGPADGDRGLDVAPRDLHVRSGCLSAPACPTDAWRKGLASEGARELIRPGFEDLGLSGISAETMTVNAGSRATMAAVGMEHVRTFHMDWDEPIPGAEQGEVAVAIARGRQWLAG